LNFNYIDLTSTLVVKTNNDRITSCDLPLRYICIVSLFIDNNVLDP